jgi:thioredoxin 1
MNPRFLQIIKSSKPVLVDFYADWCIPCKQVMPVLKKVKEDIGQVKIVKVDVDKNPFIASHFNINQIPTLIIFKDGKPLWTGEGVYSAEELKTIIRHRLSDD